MSDDTLLSVSGLKKHYLENDTYVDALLNRESRRIRAVDGVSFDIHEGETLALVGESGCGKSTTGETLLRLRDPTEGDVEFDGEAVFEMSSRETREFRKRAQIVFQDPYSALNPRMTTGDIIAEPLKIHGLGLKEERQARTKQLLEDVGLSADQIDRYPREFSGGQRQRVNFARALAVDPEFIVLDEPVSALDMSVQAQVLNLLNRLQNDFDLTYLFIAHDLGVVRYLADRVAVMYLGEIVEIGPTDAIFQEPSHPYTQALLDSVPRPDSSRDRLTTLPGDVPSPENPPTGCRFHSRCPHSRETCTEKSPRHYRTQSQEAACFRLDSDHEYWNAEQLETSSSD